MEYTPKGPRVVYPAGLTSGAHFKCLAADPRDRYPTAGLLANDLRNWLDGKPISAHPPGVIEQAVKWTRRNKKLAGMGLAVLLTMAAATAVSVGFGLETEKQADIARKKQKDAEDAAGRLEVEKRKSDQEVERTQRTLAKALLAPISQTSANDVLSEYERNALWEIAEARDTPVPVLLLDAATRSELTAVQLHNRAAFLDHAAVGLDRQKRRLADELVPARLGDPQLPSGVKRFLALAAVEIDRFAETEAMAEVLTKASDRTGRGTWRMGWGRRPSVCRRTRRPRCAGRQPTR